MSYVWTVLSRAAGSNQAGPGPPCPCRGQRASLHTHACGQWTATPICSCCAYECRSAGQDCPSRPASADQPDAALCLAPLCLWLPYLLFDCDPPPGLRLGLSRQSSSLWYDVWSAVVVNTRQGSDRGMGRGVRSCSLGVATAHRCANLQGLSVWICAVVQLQPTR